MAGNFQVHHIIPLEIFKDYGPKIDGILGENWQQDYNNRISLFSDPEFAAKVGTILDNDPSMADKVGIGSAQHHGSHPAYNAFVQETQLLCEILARRQAGRSHPIINVSRNLRRKND